MSSTLDRRLSSPGQRNLPGGVTEPLSGPDYLPIAQNRIGRAEGRAQREVRDESYPPCVAILEHGH